MNKRGGVGINDGTAMLCWIPIKPQALYIIGTYIYMELQGMTEGIPSHRYDPYIVFAGNVL